MTYFNKSLSREIKQILIIVIVSANPLINLSIKDDTLLTQDTSSQKI